MESSSGADKAALERSYSAPPRLDPTIAAALLTGVKAILDTSGVTFFLRQGTCLGAIRDNRFIAWDDDIDIGSIIGLHGVTESTIDSSVTAFEEDGYFVERTEGEDYIGISMIKASTRIDWTCYRIVDGTIYHYPGMRIPASLFVELKEIDFVGTKFLVPDPPEDYLRLKYGAEWMIPKEDGFEDDVFELVPDAPTRGGRDWLTRVIGKYVVRAGGGRIRVLDPEGRPVGGTEVNVGGICRSMTNKLGYASVHLPRDDWYAVLIEHGDHRELLYQEKLTRTATYVYRPDPLVSTGRLCVLSEGTS